MPGPGGVPGPGGSGPRGLVGCLVPGGCLVLGGVPGPGGLVPGGCVVPGGGAWWRPPQTATAVGGTHPTGMHSCSSYFWLKSLFLCM